MDHLTVIQRVCVWLLPVLFAITIHEVAHGYVAGKLGDKTAFILGRISLNPLKHIDLVGSVIVPTVLLLFGNGVIFGWAKPVPINVLNLAKPKRDMALVALAGPVSNFLMAIAWASIAKFGLLCVQHGYEFVLPIVYMGQAGIVINFMLMVLNMLPLPPLDGWHLLVSILPRHLVRKLNQFSPFSFLVLSMLIILGIVNKVINPLVMLLCNLVMSIFGV